jgi:nucleoside-diphosphate-sugar epimerase
MQYFITGATGFIGGHVAQQLVAAGHEVRALVRTPAKARHLTELGISLHAGDISDKDSMHAPMVGVDGVFHIAGWYKIGVRDTTMAERINVEGTRNVLELMRELDIPKGVYTSTLAVFSDTHGKLVDETYRHNGPWLSEYDRTKWMAHYEVAEPMMKEGLPLVIVQPGLVYGPGDVGRVHTALVQFLERRLPLAPQQTAFCWGHVEDTAQGHILAMEHGKPGESYIIAGPAHTFIEAVLLAQRITGIPAPRLHPSRRFMQRLAILMGVVEKFVPLPETYRAESLRVTAGVTYLGTNEKAKRELGFSARPLENGLRETLQYEMQQLGMDLMQYQGTSWA